MNCPGSTATTSYVSPASTLAGDGGDNRYTHKGTADHEPSDGIDRVKQPGEWLELAPPDDVLIFDTLFPLRAVVCFAPLVR
jgi:hypothetical protein